MKMAVSIWCVVVLSLFAVRAGAQLDSNAIVIFHDRSAFGECYNMAIGLSGNPNQYSANPLGVMWIDTSFRFPSNGSIHLNEGIMSAYLVLDTITKTFRRFVLSSNCISKNYYGNNDNSCYSWPIQCYGYEQSSILFRMTADSVPYADSSGIISAAGVFELPYSISAQYECLEGHQDWTGSCLDSGYLPDTLEIKIIPNAFAGVAFDRSLTRRVVILDPTSSFVLCSLSISQPASYVQVFDLMGRVVAVIRPQFEDYGMQAQIPQLPPGCYFSRLGDEMAKFVVPLR